MEVNIEELRKYSLFVGTPMYGGQCSGLYTKSSTELAELSSKYGIKVEFYYLFNESLVQRARNYVVDEFLRSDCTHMIFIDSDIGFKANDVLYMLAMQTQSPDQFDILTGSYPKKTIAWEKVKKAVQMGKGENPFHLQFFASDYALNMAKNEQQTFKLNEPVAVKDAGTGFMLIPRNSFENYEKTYPEFRYIPDHARSSNFDGSREIMAYFDCGIDKETKRYLSEDYFFCRNAIKAGIKIHTCPWIELNHVGSYVYKGSFAAMAAIDAPLTTDKSSNPNTYDKKP